MSGSIISRRNEMARKMKVGRLMEAALAAKVVAFYQDSIDGLDESPYLFIPDTATFFFPPDGSKHMNIKWRTKCGQKVELLLVVDYSYEVSSMTVIDEVGSKLAEWNRFGNGWVLFQTSW